jgi:acetolactate synthase-1/2/3 large subunit
VILISDGGEFGQWAQAALSADLRIINGVAGTIGGGLAYGMGAQIARPDAIVVCLMGDGTIGFHLAEYETAARENLPVLTVIGNDKRWNAEYQIQLRDFGEDRTYACELSHAEYGRAVEALGCFGADIDHLSALPESLNQALVKRLPACINVTIDPIAYAGGGK